MKPVAGLFRSRVAHPFNILDWAVTRWHTHSATADFVRNGCNYVNMESSAEKIAMTAPVNQQVQDGRWRITFTMPAEYSLESLPEPLDDRITLKQEPGRLMAVIRYSGSWSQKLYQEKVAMLKAFLKKREITAVGEPIFARYNSPFSLWFLRRNEILIPVDSLGSQGSV